MRVMIDLGATFFSLGGQSCSISTGWLYWKRKAEETRDMPWLAVRDRVRGEGLGLGLGVGVRLRLRLRVRIRVRN